MEKSFEEKVEELWNREQIKSLTYAYGECVLRRDAEGMAKLFTEDGSADFSSLGWGVHQGHEAIKKLYAGTWAYRVKPFFTNHYIEFIDQTHARGWCWLDNRAARDGESLIGCGKIYDEYQIGRRPLAIQLAPDSAVLPGPAKQGLEQGTRGIHGRGTALALNVRRTYWDRRSSDAAGWDAARCRRTGAARRRLQQSR